MCDTRYLLLTSNDENVCIMRDPLLSTGSETGIFSVLNKNAVIEAAMIDFSGSGVIHMTGGLSALYATCLLGPRQGRFYDRHGNKLATPGLRKGTSVALQVRVNRLFCIILLHIPSSSFRVLLSDAWNDGVDVRLDWFQSWIGFTRTGRNE